MPPHRFLEDNKNIEGTPIIHVHRKHFWARKENMIGSSTYISCYVDLHFGQICHFLSIRLQFSTEHLRTSKLFSSSFTIRFSFFFFQGIQLHDFFFFTIYIPKSVFQICQDDIPRFLLIIFFSLTVSVWIGSVHLCSIIPSFCVIHFLIISYICVDCVNKYAWYSLANMKMFHHSSMNTAKGTNARPIN